MNLISFQMFSFEVHQLGVHSSFFVNYLPHGCLSYHGGGGRTSIIVKKSMYMCACLYVCLGHEDRLTIHSGKKQEKQQEQPKHAAGDRRTPALGSLWSAQNSAHRAFPLLLNSVATY